MGNLDLFRTISVIILAVIGEIQIYLYFESQNYLQRTESTNFFYDSSRSSKPKLPIIERQYPESLIEWAEKYLNLPVWSKGYHHCYSNESEVSCFELYRAAKIIEHWCNNSQKNQNNGLVFVNITNESFFDRLSMLYHGLQIAISSNRALYVDKDAFLPIQLPSSIKNVSRRKNQTKPENNDNHSSNNNFTFDNFCEKCFQIPTDYRFGCFEADINKNPNITFSGASYPQVLYTHHPIGNYLYENFGFHSAHFIGNFLFGSYVKPENGNMKCEVKSKISIEGWNFNIEKRFSNPSEFHSYVSKCSACPNLFNSQMKDDVAFITNIDLNESQKNKYSEVLNVDILNDNSESSVCGLYSLMSSEWIISTFGSRMGFWASALLGSKSSIFNSYSLNCANLTFSQQGSLFHSESPPDMKEVFRINTFLYPCRRNNIEANRYLENLLW